MSGTLTTGKLILTNTQSNQDAFDRLRVSNPFTLFEITHQIGKTPIIVDEIVSGAGATSNYIANNSYIQMGVTGAPGATGKVIRQTYEYVPYQPGKSKLMYFSGVLEALQGGVLGSISRIGCFDSTIEKTSVVGPGNGCFFELNGPPTEEADSILYAVIRLNDVDTKVQQSLWNYDKFDGTGPSGLTIDDYSKCLILGIDQEWLGVGQVRFGFFVNGSFHLGHSFNHFGVNAIVYPYTRTAKLPLRFEISSTSSTQSEMRMICGSVISEGGFEPIGSSFSIGSIAGKVVGNTLVPIMSLKLKPNEPLNRKTLVLKNMIILNRSASRGTQWDLYLLPSQNNLTGHNFQDANATNSAARYDISATAVSLTGATLIESGYMDLAQTVGYNFTKYLSAPLVNCGIDGTSRVLCLAGVRITTGGTNPTINASMSWFEIQ